MWLFVLFVAIPMLEIALFIQVGGFLGLWPTLGIVILTAFVGTILVRSQGLAAISEIQTKISEVRDPTEALANGAMILAAGLLLLTPGFFTDTVGISLLLPPVRKFLFNQVKSRIKLKGQYEAEYRFDPREETIDGDFEAIDPDTKPSGTSKWTRD